MHIVSIERQVGTLPINENLAEALRQARQAKPEAAEMVGLTDLTGLEEAHTLDEARVAALLADPLEQVSKG